jgi:hypothetical protein
MGLLELRKAEVRRIPLLSTPVNNVEYWCMSYWPAFALVRLNLFHEADIRSEPKVLVTVKKIVWDREVAELEVLRLSRLSDDKDVTYFSTYTRLEQR